MTSCVAFSGCGANFTSTPGSSATSAGSIVASPTSVDFGTVNDGTSANSQVVITNPGQAGVQISQLTISDSTFSVDGQGNLPVTLGAASTLNLKVHFNPASNAASSGQLTITSNSISTPTVSVTLHGQGANGTSPTQPTLSSLSCNSGAMTGAGSDACTVTLSSVAPSGGATVTLASNSAAVSVPATVSVPANSTSVGFTATVSSVSTAQTASLTATAGGASQSFSLQLNPPATPPSTAALSALSCASTSLSGAGTDSCTVTLTAAAPSGGLSVSLSSNNSVVTTPASVTVPASTSSVGFTATVGSFTSSQTATLTASAGGVTKSTSLQLTPGTPTLSASTTSVDFGNVVVGQTANQSVTLNATGTAPVTVSSMSVAGSLFSASGITTPLTLNPGQSVPVTLTFAPAKVTDYNFTGVLTIASNSSQGNIVINMSGSGTSNAPTLSINATSVSFGNVLINAPATQSVKLSSTGGAAVTVSAATVSGTGFSLSGGTFPATLNPGQSLTLNVQFDPSSAGAATGQLTITSNSSSNSTAVVSLTGTGESHEVALSWTAPSSSSDPVAGYNVYRAPSGSSYQLVNSSMDTQTTYTDNSVQGGQTYTYVVKSVDSSGTESSPSNSINVTIP